MRNTWDKVETKIHETETQTETELLSSCQTDRDAECKCFENTTETAFTPKKVSHFQGRLHTRLTDASQPAEILSSESLWPPNTNKFTLTSAWRQVNRRPELTAVGLSNTIAFNCLSLTASHLFAHMICV